MIAIESPNMTAAGGGPDSLQQGLRPEEESVCVLGFIPIIYYSALLCVGLPVNILTAVVLSRLAGRTQKALYVYLLAVTGSDILSQLFIIFVGFLLEPAVFHRRVPPPLLRYISALEFAANHASIWAAVPLTVDRYVALCHPLLHRQISYPERARRVAAAVLALALASGVPFFWWSDMWRVGRPPTPVDAALIWTHVTIIYFLPCSIFLVLNSLIIRRLRARQRRPCCQEECGGGGGLAPPPPPRRRRRLWLGKTTAMLLAVTSVFSVLWAPRTVVVIYHLYVSSVHHNWRVHLAYDLSNMLAMLNTAVNFFLYCFVSQPFRAAVHDVLLMRGAGTPLRPRPRPPQRGQQHATGHTSTSSLSSGHQRSSHHHHHHHAAGLHPSPASSLRGTDGPRDPDSVAPP